jgi:hypothetical protein
MRGRTPPSLLTNSPLGPGSLPHAPAQTAPFSSFLADRLTSDIARLDDLEHVWLPLALRGNAKAADLILTLQRQRAALVQLALQAAAQAEQHEAALKMASGEQRIVVEYVDDWRTAGRRDVAPIESRRVSSDASLTSTPQ